MTSVLSPFLFLAAKFIPISIGSSANIVEEKYAFNDSVNYYTMGYKNLQKPTLQLLDQIVH